MRTGSAYRSRRFGKPLEYQWLSDLPIRIMPIGIRYVMLRTIFVGTVLRTVMMKP